MIDPIEFISPFAKEEKPEPRNEWHRRLLEQVEAEAKETSFSEEVNIKHRDIAWY